MARKADKDSNRQKAFAMLDKLAQEGSRTDAVGKLMSTLKIKRPYAMTLFQQHRNTRKEDGTLKEAFVVRDTKNGLKVDPYVSTSYVVDVEASGGQDTVAKAVKSYIESEQAKIKAARELKKG